MSSGSDSDSDDSEKRNAVSELFNLSKPSGKDVAAESGNSSAAEDEDDFNPFRMSGSEDEGSHLIIEACGVCDAKVCGQFPHKTIVIKNVKFVTVMRCE